MLSTTDWKVWSLLGGAISGCWFFLIKHMTNSTRHPNGDKIVYTDLYEKAEKSNDQAHKDLRKAIDDSETRSEKRHNELKRDVKDGFTEIKVLIQTKM